MRNHESKAGLPEGPEPLFPRPVTASDSVVFFMGLVLIDALADFDENNTESVWHDRVRTSRQMGLNSLTLEQFRRANMAALLAHLEGIAHKKLAYSAYKDVCEDMGLRHMSERGFKKQVASLVNDWNRRGLIDRPRGRLRGRR